MIIGLTGYAQSGKDTVASLLVEHYGYTRVAFADKIRELLHEMNPLIGLTRLNDIVNEYGWDIAKQNPEVRSLLQNLGVGARTLFGTNFWVHEAMKTMLNAPKPDLKYVVTDVRFFNEADMIKANNGQIWRVTRPGVGPVNSHVSESELDSIKVDAVINNDSDFKDLMIEVHSVL
jgi:dephospho-CoA kinase